MMVYAPVFSYVVFVLSLFIPHLSFFWCIGRAALRDDVISWILSLIQSTLVISKS